MEEEDRETMSRHEIVPEIKIESTQIPVDIPITTVPYTQSIKETVLVLVDETKRHSTVSSKKNVSFGVHHIPLHSFTPEFMERKLGDAYKVL
jgi:hypothetical protein